MARINLCPLEGGEFISPTTFIPYISKGHDILVGSDAKVNLVDE
jgi:hypothetical protein